ncbi:MAG: hypothetical protein Q8M98_07020 [Candidatus Cloacimonadaceae bacterium]|nr:hypothetical protein [Candidatus Cloacimonadaceae bacterium]
MPYLMFLDESFRDRQEYAQISGFVISIKKYVKLRNNVITNHINDRRKIEPLLRIDLHDLPFYKWSKFMEKYPDDSMKFATMKYLFSQLYKHSELVFCYGILGPLLFSQTSSETDLLRFCWFQLQYLFNGFQYNDVVIPIVDLGADKGFKKVYSIYAEQNYLALNDVLHCGDKSVTIKNPSNCLEPFFSKDEYSIGVQLADLVGGFKLFNSKVFGKHSPFNTERKKILEKWQRNIKTTCIFESWVEDDDIWYHAEFNDSIHQGQEYRPRKLSRNQ